MLHGIRLGEALSTGWPGIAIIARLIRTDRSKSRKSLPPPPFWLRFRLGTLLLRVFTDSVADYQNPASYPKRGTRERRTRNAIMVGWGQ